MTNRSGLGRDQNLRVLVEEQGLDEIRLYGHNCMIRKGLRFIIRPGLTWIDRPPTLLLWPRACSDVAPQTLEIPDLLQYKTSISNVLRDISYPARVLQVDGRLVRSASVL